jgi:hypothetical protein
MGATIANAMMIHDIAMIQADPHHAAIVLGIKAAVMIPFAILVLRLLCKPAATE